jgi:heme-degrading monooxygenase HmoA
MFSVIFEVRPREDQFDDYLALAKQLRPILETIDGFIDNERFQSRSRPGWLLSHSTWRDEKSVVRWRTVAEHHQVQQRGREEILADYHLRVGDVTADTDEPVHQQRFDATEAGAATTATLTELTPEHNAYVGDATDAIALTGLDAGLPGLVDHDMFTSIYNPGKLALLASWTDAEAAAAWSPTVSMAGLAVRHRVVRVVRDYAMFDRREAPQYYPDAEGRETLHAQPVEQL